MVNGQSTLSVVTKVLAEVYIVQSDIKVIDITQPVLVFTQAIIWQATFIKHRKKVQLAFFESSQKKKKHMHTYHIMSITFPPFRHAVSAAL